MKEAIGPWIVARDRAKKKVLLEGRAGQTWRDETEEHVGCPEFDGAPDAVFHTACTGCGSPLPEFDPFNDHLCSDCAKAWRATRSTFRRQETT